jgi:hypothetical protein
MRPEYQAFPLAVFRDHIYQEQQRSRRERGYWLNRIRNGGGGITTSYTHHLYKHGHLYLLSTSYNESTLDLVVSPASTLVENGPSIYSSAKWSKCRLVLVCSCRQQNGYLRWMDILFEALFLRKLRCADRNEATLGPFCTRVITGVYKFLFPYMRRIWQLADKHQRHHLLWERH